MRLASKKYDWREIAADVQTTARTCSATGRQYGIGPERSGFAPCTVCIRRD